MSRRASRFHQSLQREIDVVCLGRAGVDFYANEAGQPFRDISSFNKYVGGSPANIAVAIAKQSGKASLLSKVSQDMLGEYVCHYLSSVGVGTSGIKKDDSGSRTSLAICEMKPTDCQVVLYRNNAADLLLAPEEIDVEQLAKATILLISGTALSQSPSREAAFYAMQQAKSCDTCIALDLDYRDYSWSSRTEASIYYQQAASFASLIFGNNEEFSVFSNGDLSDETIAIFCFKLGCDTVFLKSGDQGSTVFTHEGHQFHQPAFSVDCKKPYGAGDAYAGTILLALARGKALEEAVRLGAAAAAINVSRLNCSEAMPTTDELNTFIKSHEKESYHGKTYSAF